MPATTTLRKIRYMTFYKLLSHFGALRKDKKFGVTYFLLLLGGFFVISFGLSSFFTGFLTKTTRIETVELILSIFFSTQFILGMIVARKGGISIFTSEYHYVACTPITPLQYLISDTFFQFFSSNFLSMPVFLPLICVVGGYFLKLDAFEILVMICFALFYSIIEIMFSQGLGTLLSKTGSELLTNLVALSLVLITAMQYPLLLFTDLSIDKIYTPPFTAALTLSYIFGKRDLIYPPIAFTIFVIITLLIYWRASRLWFFNYIGPNYVSSVFDVTSYTTRLRHKQVLYLFEKFSKIIPIPSTRRAFFTLYHLSRMIRDGTLWVMTISIIIFFVNIIFVNPGKMLGLYKFVNLLALIAVANMSHGLLWIAHDRINMWIPLSAPNGVRKVLEGFERSLIILNLILSLPYIALNRDLLSAFFLPSVVALIIIPPKIMTLLIASLREVGKTFTTQFILMIFLSLSLPIVLIAPMVAGSLFYPPIDPASMTNYLSGAAIYLGIVYTILCLLLNKKISEYSDD